MIDKFLNMGGWVEDEKLMHQILAKQDNPLLATCNFQIKGTSRGKQLILSDYILKVLTEFNLREQTIGDCTGNALCCTIDILKAIGCVKNNEDFLSESAVEVSYGFGRVEVANSIWKGQDGCSGAAICEGAKKFGTLRRKKYGTIDLSRYDGNVSRKFGDTGVPDSLEPEAREHICKSISLVTTFEDAADAIYNGFPIVVCSNVGFDCKRDRYGKILRDQDGFLYEAGSWSHAMCLMGVDWDERRPSLLCQNSWGDFCSGGSRLNQPKGSFWIDASTIEKMLRQQDSFAISNFQGYPKQKLNLRIL